MVSIKSKQELKDIIYSSRSSNYSKEVVWKSHFSNFYNELQELDFPTSFSFPQKIYHYLNDDPELKLGVCPVCKNRCAFQSIRSGYLQYCSKKCASNSDDYKNNRKQNLLTKLYSTNKEKFELRCIKDANKNRINNLSNLKTKQEIKDCIFSIKNNRYTSEKFWIKHFYNAYCELQTWVFPDNFIFQQKIYHYLNDDPELKLGICPECGKRSKFITLTQGYHKYCSVSCSKKSECIKCKYKESSLRNYGVDHPLKSKIIRNKISESRKNKSEYEKCKTREKYKSTCLDKFGVENPSQADEIKEKKERTSLANYGTKHPFQSEVVQNHSKQTCLEKYGIEYFMQTDEFKEKSKETCLEKYRKENYSQTDEFKNKFKDAEWVKLIQDKSYKTKKKNNTFHTSKIEQQIKLYLDSLGVNYIYQYTSELYPFSCDFYFPDKDLYVEIQGSWTHGFKPFENTEEDRILLEKWKSKNTKYYQNAIETWTIRDVNKREIAKKNNLNYLEIFSIDLETCINLIYNL